MNILSLETSGRKASLATLREEGRSARTIRERLLPGRRGTAKDITPAMSGLLAESGWVAGDVQLVSVSIGPGSFTGLRVGVTVAKTFAYAIGADLLGISTLRAIAQQAAVNAEAGHAIRSVIAAERNQVFAAQYLVNPAGEVGQVGEVSVINANEWIQSLRPGDIATGPALEKLASSLPENVRVATSSLWQPTAGMIGRLSWVDYQNGRREDVWGLVPLYYRLSAAEEKLGMV